MSPKKLSTRPATRAEAVGRRRIAEKYLELAEVAAADGGEAINVAIGVAVLAGIAASDAICIAAIGERYSGQDHAAGAELLGRVDAGLGGRLRDLAELKGKSHYGQSLLSGRDRDRAMRAARSLVEGARQRTV